MFCERQFTAPPPSDFSSHEGGRSVPDEDVRAQLRDSFALTDEEWAELERRVGLAGAARRREAPA